MKREPRYYEISRKQIFLSIFIASLVLTVVFNIGIYVGKRKVINAELKEEQQKFNNIISEIEAIDYSITNDYDAEKQIEKRPEIEKELSENKKVNIEKKNSNSNKEMIEKEKSFSEKKRYTIKVGTFAHQQNAENLSNLIKSSGYESWIVNEPDLKTFHVMVGKFDNMNSAESFGKKLQIKHQFIKGYIIKELKDE